MFWLWIVSGALTQIGGTALMLMTMTERSFVVTVAYLKTEPLFVAVLGLVFLHDPLTPGMVAAILIATAGVVLISLRAGTQLTGGDASRPSLALPPAAMFAMSAIGYRGAILALHLPGYLMPATFALAVGLVVQAAC